LPSAQKVAVDHPFKRNLALSFFGVAREQDLVFIAIGKLHTGLAWDIRVIPSWKQIRPNIS
jgi:hypothetical protein